MLSKTPRESFGQLLIKKRSLTLLILMILIALIFSLAFSETYLSLDNLGVILLNMSADALILLAITLLLIIGEIDLSLGAIMLFSGVICGRLMITLGWPMVLAVVVSFVIAIFLGAINGYIVAKLGVISFIGTIATSAIFSGAAIMLAGPGLSGFNDPTFAYLGQGVLFGFIQFPVLYAVAIIAAFAFLLSKNTFFRKLYFIGGNLKAAQLSGINIYKTKMIIYIIAAMLACASGIIASMRFDAASTKIGMGIELKAVTAAVIGGVSFSGGTGTITGAAMGGLFVAFLNNALAIAQVSPDLQFVAIGAVLIMTIVINNLVAKKAR
jgi:ribose transport system permease protein